VVYRRKKNHSVLTEDGETFYTKTESDEERCDISKLKRFTGNVMILIPAAPQLNYLFISVGSNLLIHLTIDFVCRALLGVRRDNVNQQRKEKFLLREESTESLTALCLEEICWPHRAQ